MTTITVDKTLLEQAIEALENIAITGPDDDGVVWLNLPGNGTTGKAIIRVGKSGLIASQCATLAGEQCSSAADALRAALAEPAVELSALELGQSIAAWTGGAYARPRADTGELEQRIDCAVERLGYAVLSFVKASPPPPAEPRISTEHCSLAERQRHQASVNYPSDDLYCPRCQCSERFLQSRRCEPHIVYDAPSPPAALAEPAAEPVAHATVRPLQPDECERKVIVKWVNRPVPGLLYASPPPPAEPAVEPVAWTSMGQIRFTPPTCDRETYTPLYTSPPPPAEVPLLSIKELADLTATWAHIRSDHSIGIAQAAEKAVRQKAGLK